MDQQPEPTEVPDDDASPDENFEPTLPPGEQDGVEDTQMRTISGTERTLPMENSATVVPSGSQDSQNTGSSSAGSMGSSFATQDPSPSEGLRAGLELRNYRLIEQVGEGAQGQVWKAYNSLAKKDMALKFMSSKLAKRVQAASFEGEASVLFDLTHESIVRLNIPEAIDGHTFLVMEFLGGPSLSSLLGQRRRETKEGLAPEECVWVLAQLAPALDYAAEKKVTHRDIKPGNIMLTHPVEARSSLAEYEGQVKLCDFGIAFVAQTDERDSNVYSAAGTPPYMAPEVIRGEKPDHVSDIYSLGATLYAMVKGKPPHRGSMRSILSQQKAGPPPPIESGSKALDQAVARALSFDPADRYNSADDFLYEASGQKLGRRAERKTRQAWTFVVAAVIAVASVVFALNRPGLDATEMELIRPALGERLIKSRTVDVEFRIDRSDIKTATVGFIETAEAYRSQEIFRDRDGVFRTSLSFPAQGTFPLEIRTDDVVWGTFQLKHDSEVSLPDNAFRVLDEGPFQAGDEIRCSLTHSEEGEETLTVYEMTSGSPRKLDIPFVRRSAEFVLIAPDIGEATEVPVEMELQIQDAALNRKTTKATVQVYNRSALVAALKASFPLKPGLQSAHPWDLETSRVRYGEWLNSVASSGVVKLSDLDDDSEAAAQRANLRQLLEQSLEERPEPKVRFDSTSQGTILFDAGLHQLFTRNLQVEVLGTVLGSRGPDLERRAGEAERTLKLDRETGAFRDMLVAAAGVRSEYEFTPYQCLQSTRLVVLHDDETPTLRFLSEGVLRSRSEQITLEVSATDSFSGVAEVRAGDTAFGPDLLREAENVWFATLPLPAEGENVIQVLARDLAGNETTEQRVVIRDLRAPKIVESEAITSPIEGGKPVHLRLIFDEALSEAKVRYTTEGDPAAGLEEVQLDDDAITIEGASVILRFPLRDSKANNLRVDIETKDLAGNSGIGKGSWEMIYNPWGNVPTRIAEAAEIVTGEVLAKRLPPDLAADPYVRVDGARYPRLIRHRRTGVEFVFVPPGEFVYGEPGTTAASVVRMSGYYIARTEISRDQFAKGDVPPELQGEDLAGFLLPAQVYWREAYLWSDSAGFRLPSEAQWEYAASGPENRNYPWGDLFDASRAACSSDEIGQRLNRPFEVDDPAFRGGMSWCGAVQMAGNVYEYCLDVNLPNEVRPQTLDPEAPMNPGMGQARVLRGGGYSVRQSRTELFSTYFRDPRPTTGPRRNGFRPVWLLE